MRSTEINYYNRVREASEYIKSIITHPPKIAIAIGSGQQGVITAMEVHHELAYDDIPHMPAPTAPSHVGRLLVGTLEGIPVCILSGRLHYYEGYTMQEVTYPIRILGMLGISYLLLTNVAGGLQAQYAAGDFIHIRDHINLMPDNPLRGPNHEAWGPRFPDMSAVYDAHGLQTARSLSSSLGLSHHEGIYVALPGPNLETRAEYSYLHHLDADVVGMSTLPEVLVARHMNIRCNVVSMVSNVCYPPEAVTPTTIEEVVAVAREREQVLTDLIVGMVEGYSKNPARTAIISRL